MELLLDGLREREVDIEHRSRSWARGFLLLERDDRVPEVSIRVPSSHRPEGLEKGNAVPALAEGECPQGGILHQSPRYVPGHC